MFRSVSAILFVAWLAACQTPPEAEKPAKESARVVSAWNLCKSDIEGALAQRVYNACTQVIAEAENSFWQAAAYNNRSLVLRYWGRHEEELDDLNNAIRLNPEYSPAHNNRGWVYAIQGNFELAFADFEMALRLNPDSALAHNNYAWFLAETGDYAAASKHAERAIALTPGGITDELNAIDTQAHVAMGLGQVAEAEEAFAKAMRLGGIEWISAYQKALVAKGYAPGRTDGLLDEATKEAFSACIRDNCRLMVE